MPIQLRDGKFGVEHDGTDSCNFMAWGHRRSCWGCHFGLVGPWTSFGRWWRWNCCATTSCCDANAWHSCFLALILSSCSSRTSNAGWRWLASGRASRTCWCLDACLCTSIDCAFQKIEWGDVWTSHHRWTFEWTRRWTSKTSLKLCKSVAGRHGTGTTSTFGRSYRNQTSCRHITGKIEGWILWASCSSTWWTSSDHSNFIYWACCRSIADHERRCFVQFGRSYTTSTATHLQCCLRRPTQSYNFALASWKISRTNEDICICSMHALRMCVCIMHASFHSTYCTCGGWMCVVHIHRYHGSYDTSWYISIIFYQQTFSESPSVETSSHAASVCLRCFKQCCVLRMS